MRLCGVVVVGVVFSGHAYVYRAVRGVSLEPHVKTHSCRC